ncbi:hypothetical protein FCL49_11050 [Serratia proteamaculans]|uniref:hypothetical protein n=1 Tax=Serratia proteamaculans TaxID=28151 RepID=UPI0015771E0D|nr:hypothetical protein [Serratia proteamaculans]NTX79436.1 hypothetical protein [Serratia proteamaculans]NTZ28638.1 hypothetical protein [Serratia proteamaculans]
MDDIPVLEKLREIINALEKENNNNLENITNEYRKTISEIVNGTLSYNLIHNSVKAYLEIYNDYDNPLLYTMSDAEELVSRHLDSMSTKTP